MGAAMHADMHADMRADMDASSIQDFFVFFANQILLVQID
jgi:hypothetical protein